jgi:hypothetical protein
VTNSLSWLWGGRHSSLWWGGRPARRNDSHAPAAARCALLTCLTLTSALADSPFATRVVGYNPQPGQFTNNPAFNDPARALGPPVGGSPSQPDNTKLVTLGLANASFITPTQTLAFADAAINTSRGSLIEYPFIEPPLWPPTTALPLPDTPPFAPDPSMHFRHSGPATPRAAAVALDGHARSLPPQHTATRTIYGPLAPAMRLGWPKPPGPGAAAPWFDFGPS